MLGKLYPVERTCSTGGDAGGSVLDDLKHREGEDADGSVLMLCRFIEGS